MRDRLKSFDQSLYITGFMASGKTTLAKGLSKALEMEHKDLDHAIEDREGRSIQAIFEEKGEPYFREKEKETLIDLTNHFKGIVSLGGGALQNQMIVDHLKVNGLLIFLDTPFDKIIDRVKSGTERPILYDEDGKIKSDTTLKSELEALYSKRLKYYKQAQVRIDSSKYGTKSEIEKAAIDKIRRHV